jgi:polar amino acid transport system permease protein
MAEWDFGFLLDHKAFILKGLLGTIRLTGVSLSAGVLIGLLIAGARLSPMRVSRLAGAAYVEIFRNIPSLVQIFWWYFTLPVLTGLQPDPFLAAAIGLSLYSGAYLAEIFRSGIQSIDRGQWDAARAIGLGRVDMMRDIILPQAMRRLVPALTNQVMEIVKTTAVASTVSYGELLYSAKLLSDQEFRPLESYTSLGVLFIIVLSAVGAGSNLLERRLRRQA